MRKTFVVLLVAFAAAAAHSAGYRVARHFAVGGDGGWDYPLAEGGRLYLAHSSEVDVLDLQTGRKIGVIENTAGVHGIAIARELGRGFASNGRAGTVTVFDLASLKTVATWPVTGENPDAILYDKASGRLFTFNGRTQNATVFDARSGAVVATLPLGGKPEFAVSRGDGTVFVNIEDTSELAELDAKNARVVRRWSLAPCEAPTGLAYERSHERLFSVCENKLMVISDARAGKVLFKVPIGAGTDGTAFDDERHTAFSSNGADGTMTVVREVSLDRYEVVQTIPTARGARTITLDEKTHRLYTPTAMFGPPPPPTADRPHPRASIEPGTFEVIEIRGE